MADHKKNYILDASVILKWFLPEENDAEKAIALGEDFTKKIFQAIIPEHCYYEVLNIINIKAPELTIPAFSYLLAMQMLEQRLNPQIATIASEIMQSIPKTPFYDAAYHATAIHHKGTYITDDEGYYKKARKLKHIKLLQNY